MIKKLIILGAAALLAAGSGLAKETALAIPDGAVKLTDKLDPDGWAYYFRPYDWCPGAEITNIAVIDGQYEGKGCLALSYSFPGEKDPEGRPETVYMQRNFMNWSCDYSFHPYGISLWVKGNPKNKGEFRFVLLQGDKKLEPMMEIRQMYAYSDSRIMKSKKWTRLVMPFDQFKEYRNTEGVPLDLSNIIGWRIEIVNTDGTMNHGSVLIDKIEQLTTFRPEYNKTARFNSMFIQVNAKNYNDTDWNKVFKSMKEVGIEHWIIQYCVTHYSDNVLYSGSRLEWVKGRCDVVDKMVKAAEEEGVFLTFGPYFQSWGKNADLSKPDRYNEMLVRNKQVIAELAEKFGKSPCFEGWYIGDEFHDGSMPRACWFSEAANNCLGDYLEANATYMKSLIDKPVSIAPALWRGFPAKYTADLFDRLFQRAPSIDKLYIQDCAGRGPDMVVSIPVDLFNYYEQLKKACDKNGVAFGVDIESFYRCNVLKEPRRQKTWDELKLQLWAAGAFTTEITNFSWASFKPGDPDFEGYKKYYKEITK